MHACLLARAQGKSLPGGGEKQLAMPGVHNIVVDQSILDESSQMLEFLQKENAKVKDENARLHREVI
jgi:hypothetical protein